MGLQITSEMTDGWVCLLPLGGAIALQCSANTVPVLRAVPGGKDSRPRHGRTIKKLGGVSFFGRFPKSRNVLQGPYVGAAIHGLYSTAAKLFILKLSVMIHPLLMKLQACHERGEGMCHASLHNLQQRGGLLYFQSSNITGRIHKSP